MSTTTTFASPSTSRVPRGDVTATLNFFLPPADGSPPITYVGAPPPNTPQRNYGSDPRPVRIHDLRGRESAFTLDCDAFKIVQAVPPSPPGAFTNDAAITAIYYPEVEALLRRHIPGITSVFIFDHTVRRAAYPATPRGPVQFVHIDQTAKSAAQRVRRHLGADADALLAGRYRIVNVWRPLNSRPIESFPLAFARSETLADADVVPVAHQYSSGYTGETAGIKYNPSQEWFYLSGTTCSERVLLECFDSEALKVGSTVKGGRVAHSAFDDPRSPPDAEARESIEVRALVFGG